VLARKAGRGGGFSYVTYRVRLSRRTERGMYDLARNKRTGAKRASRSGFVVPSQNEWIKAAYYDPSGGGTYSYWKYPTNPGVFGDDVATAPAPSTLNPTSGDVTNSATQPLATYHSTSPELPAPTLCPGQVSASDCSTINPLHMDPTTYGKLYQGSLGTVGQAKTVGPWGTLDQGGNAVEWTDTITPPPAGKKGRARVAAPARRRPQRARLPALALGDRPAAPGQHRLQPHLSVAGLPRRRDRQAPRRQALTRG
jgi:hypothetical protein